MPILSIIIPIYNTEKYLHRCIDSILNQSFSDFELILVNDGSVDNSLYICNQFAERDTRIKVIDQCNKGVSEARNIGLEYSTGKYISFIDSDDSIMRDMYSTLVKNIELTNCDHIICGYNEINESNNVIAHLFDLPNKTPLNSSDIIERIISSIFTPINLTNSLCHKLYRRNIIVDNHLSFKKRQRGEDWLFNIEYLQLIKSALYINTPLYNYHRNSNSIMSQILPEQFLLWKENRLVRQNLAIKYNLNPDYHSYNDLWINQLFNYLINITDSNLPNNKNILYSIFSDEELSDAYRNSNQTNRLFNILYKYFISTKKYNLGIIYLSIISYARKKYHSI